MFDYFIWDFDGTLFDAYPAMTKSLKKALEDQNIFSSEEEILKLMKITVKDAFLYYNKNFNADLEKMIEGFHFYEQNLYFDLIIPYENVEEICKEILSNNKKNYIFTHRGDSIFELLKRYNMTELFEDIVNKKSGIRKPSPEAFLSIINKYNLDKTIVLAIGDRKIDYEAAVAAGVKFCLFNPDNMNFDFNPDFEINNFNKLSDII